MSGHPGLDELPRRPLVKICGLTRLEDVLLARALGAWAVGFVFAPSPRRVTPAAARGLVELVAASNPVDPAARDPHSTLPTPPPLTVGVFGDTPAEAIASVVEDVGLDVVQLHSPAGPGGDAVREALAGRGCSLLVIQAVPVPSEGIDPRALKSAASAARRQADIVLLDTSAFGRFGGTGTPFPWAMAREVEEGPVLIAGGIHADNVTAALRESNAWGVDVSSGIERSPGIKDEAMMRRLFAQARDSVHTTKRQGGPRT